MRGRRAGGNHQGIVDKQMAKYPQEIKSTLLKNGRLSGTPKAEVSFNRERFNGTAITGFR